MNKLKRKKCNNKIKASLRERKYDLVQEKKLLLDRESFDSSC